MTMKEARIYEQMLENAGYLQHIQNQLEDACVIRFCGRSNDKLDFNLKPMYKITYDDNVIYMTKKEYLFFLKGRKLRSGLATPMARYYGWSGVEKLELFQDCPGYFYEACYNHFGC